MSRDGYAGNLDYQTSNSDRERLLARRGEVQGAETIKDRIIAGSNGRSHNGSAPTATVVNRLSETVPQLTHMDADPHPQYETRRWLYLMITPLLYLYTAWAMIKTAVYRLCRTKGLQRNSLFSNGLGPVARTVKACAGQWKALDIIYNYRFGTDRSIPGLLDDLWAGSLNCQAVRNRLRLAKLEIRKAILRIPTNDVRMVSLAAGSAQGVIEVAADLKQEGIRVSLLLIDLEPTALVYAQDLAKKHGIGDQVEILAGDVRESIKMIHKHKPHIVEMMGLLDYLPDPMAIRLIKAIRRALPADGVFMTANIYTNIERHFVKWVMGWNMIYRNPVTLGNVLASAGFSEFKVISEPLGIHGIAIGYQTVANGKARAR